MISITTETGTVVTLYAGAKECPSIRYKELQKYLLMDTGIGSDMQAVAAKFSKMNAFLTKGQTEDAKNESENLFYNIFSIMQKIDYKSYAFVCMVYSIGPRLCNDLSDEGLNDTIAYLEKTLITQNQIETALEEIKKKISFELELHFPETAHVSEDYEFYKLLREQILLSGNGMLSGEDDEAVKLRLEQISLDLMTRVKPMNFRPTDPENAVVALDKGFACLFSMVEGNGTNAPENVDIYTLYARVDFIRRSNQNAAQPQ